MGTETRIGIVAGLLIVVVASVYFFYGEHRQDEEILVAATPKPAEQLKIPISTDKKPAPTPASPVAAKPAPAKPAVTTNQPPKPTLVPPSSLSPQPQPSHPQPTAMDGPPAEHLATASGINSAAGGLPAAAGSASGGKYRIPAPLAPIDSAASAPPPTLLRTSPSPQLIDATKENPSPSHAAVFPKAAANAGMMPAHAAQENQRETRFTDSGTPRVKIEPEPARSGAPAAKESQWPKKHTAVKGETVAGLAARYYQDATKTADLVAANPRLKGRRSLKAGEEIIIPEPKASVALAKETGATAHSALSGESKTYTVQEGDTLYGIAKKLYGDPKRWQDIFTLNKDELRNDPKRLRPEMVLILPE